MEYLLNHSLGRVLCISIDNVPKLIVEAKRGGVDFDISESYSGRSFILNGSVFNKVVKNGFNQTIYYSGQESVELGCLTNGNTWIVFRSNRLGDGKKVLDGKGIVFSSLQGIANEFKLFYELLSKDNVQQFTYRGIFQREEGLILKVNDDAKSLKDEHSIRPLEYGKYSYDIGRVMNHFFVKISGDDDPNFLIECFVETKESKTAEQKLIRISEDLISNVRTLDTEKASLLTDILERVQHTKQHEFVIIVGGKSSGKSTFIERFFKVIIPDEIKDASVLVRVNVGENDGDINKIIDWLNDKLLEECETALYNGAPTADEILGIFYSEYDRLRIGPWKNLYERNKDQFKEDFGRKIEDLRTNRKIDYIKALIGNISQSRNKVPCLVLDNTDQFGIDFQERVFQYARSIYEKTVCLVIIPITDKTSWALSKSGSIQSYESETLYLPTPSPKKIIQKRIEYLEKVINIDEKQKGQYFLERGIKLEISDLQYFAKTLQSVFLKNDVVSKWIGNLSNLDIRRCLMLCKDTITSPHISIDDLLKAYYAKTADDVPIKDYIIKNAIIKKNYTSYPIGQHSFIQNLFYFNNDLNTTPLLAIRILRLLYDKSNERGSEDDYLPISQVLDYFSNMNINRLTVLSVLDSLLKKGLIYSYDPTILEIEKAATIHISPSGLEHHFWAVNDSQYLFLMLEVTPIHDIDFFNYLLENFYGRYKRHEVIIQFLTFLEQEDKKYCVVPKDDLYKGQAVVLQRLEWRKRWHLKFITK